MTELVVRRLLIDLQTPLPRRWWGGQAFRTAFMNALSMSFPVGEQYFIDAVRAGGAALSPRQRERFEAETRGFIAQEATHRHLHRLFNEHLARQGFVNHWESRARQRIERLRHLNVRHHLAATAANEHLTAIMAEHLLSHPEQWAGTEPRLQALWFWHASEELEHRSTAFDLYLALGGNERFRRHWFWMASVYFTADVLRQTVHNLRRDRSLWRWSTWTDAWRFLFGRDGVVRACAGPWRAYWRRDFHPLQLGSDRGAEWLQAQADTWRALD